MTAHPSNLNVAVHSEIRFIGDVAAVDLQEFLFCVPGHAHLEVRVEDHICTCPDTFHIDATPNTIITASWNAVDR